MQDKLLDFSLMYLECVRQKNIKEFQEMLKEIQKFVDDYPFACISCLFENLNAIYEEGIKDGIKHSEKHVEI